MLKFSKGINIKGDLAEAIVEMDYSKTPVLSPSKSILIIHICNDEGRMGAGFAKGIADNFPSVLERYRSLCRNNFNSLGSFLPCFVGKNTYIGNMICMRGVFHPKGNPLPLRYEDLDKCLAKARIYAESINADIHMPEIGTGKARGDKRTIENLLEKHFFLYESGKIYIWDNKNAYASS